jgi:cation transport ATPase
MNTRDLEELAKRYQSMTTEDLVAAATVHCTDYQAEALDLIEKELKSRNVSVDQKREIQQQVEQQELLRDEHLLGVRGWLIVFLIVVAINSIIGLFGGIDSLAKSQNFLGFLLVLPKSIIGCYGFFVLVLLIRRKPSAPEHASRWIIASFVYSLVVGFVVLAVSRSSEGFLFLPWAIATLPWLTYLEKSRRVAVTYQRKPRGSSNNGT